MPTLDTSMNPRLMLLFPWILSGNPEILPVSQAEDHDLREGLGDISFHS
jgi:hypothetical protein